MKWVITIGRFTPRQKSPVNRRFRRPQSWSGHNGGEGIILPTTDEPLPSWRAEFLKQPKWDAVLCTAFFAMLHTSVVLTSVSDGLQIHVLLHCQPTLREYIIENHLFSCWQNSTCNKVEIHFSVFLVIITKSYMQQAYVLTACSWTLYV
jgi:hypothetical protein